MALKEKKNKIWSISESRKGERSKAINSGKTQRNKKRKRYDSNQGYRVRREK